MYWMFTTAKKITDAKENIKMNENGFCSQELHFFVVFIRWAVKNCYHWQKVVNAFIMIKR